MKMERPISGKEIYREPDRTFKISAVHRFIFKFARERNDVYSLQAYRNHVRQNIPDKKAQDKAIQWNLTTARKLVAAGYLIDKGHSEYLLNPIAMAYLEEMKTRKAPFELKDNHRKLLMKHKEGSIHLADLKAAYQDKPQFERERQTKMLDGMIRNLKNNGYLESMGSGHYKLTENAWLALSVKAERALRQTEKNIEQTVETVQVESQEKSQQKIKIKTEGVKVTAFDRVLYEVSVDGVIQADKVNAHEKSERLKKRIEMLSQAGFIQKDHLTEALIERIELAIKRSKEKGIVFETLTREQQQVIQDMRLFLNLTQSQIIKFIYHGDTDLAKSDLKYLLEKQILVKDDAWNVYVLGKSGIKLSNDISPDAIRYKTKLFSRREEVGHDVLVYTAFKELEKELLREGKQIVSIKNDRQLRSEDAKKFGAMVGSYPDLRVAYIDPRTGLEKRHDLEVDCGYDERTIQQKISGFFGSGGKSSAGAQSGSSQASAGQGAAIGSSGFSWYCNTAKQAIRVANVINKDKSRRLQGAKHLNIYVIDAKGELKQTKWW